MRLYTGSLYKIMARVFRDTSDDAVAGFVHPDAKATVQILRKIMTAPKTPLSFIRLNEAFYYALCNAKRRAPEKMTGPLFAGSREISHLVISEEQFRKSAAESLTNYVHAGGAYLPGVDFSAMNKVVERISGKGANFDELEKVEEFGDAWRNNPDALAEHALKDFWFGMRHIASALKSLILESKVMVEDKPMPVYRGMKEDFDGALAEDSFVSVSRDEEVSRNFTTNVDLEWDDDDVGAPNQCCMVRVSLLVGTPYLDVDAALTNTNGWGYGLGEKELLLPPGLGFLPGPNGGYMNQPAIFPEEIDESNDSDSRELDIERNYDVTYWIARPRGAD